MADIKMINKKTSSLQISEQDPQNNDQPSQDEADDLQKFTHWDDNGEPPMNDESASVNRGGWSVEEMFRTNQSMGVQSTFKDDLTQYTTVPAEGTKEDRARAAKIAKEIETSEKSKRMAYLENDDEERDLDKETVIPDEAVNNEGQGAAGYHQQKRNSRGSKGGNNKSFGPPRKEIVVPENHRANALRDPPPPPRNRQEHGRQRDRGSQGKTSYQAGPSNAGNNNNNGDNHQQQSRPPPQPLPQQQQQQLQQLESPSNQKSQNFSRRKEDLKSWQNNFNAAYRQNSQSGSTSPQKTPTQVSPPVQQQPQQQPPLFPPQQQSQPVPVNPTFQQHPPQPTAPIYPPRPTNAWQKGPPDFSSHQPLLQQQQRPQQQPQPQQPPPQAFINPQFNQPLPNVTPSTVHVQPTQSPAQEQQYIEPQSQEYEIPSNPISGTVQTSETPIEQTNQSETEGSKFQFNPDAPSFVPRNVLSATPSAPSAPIVTMAQPHFIAQPYSQGYATTGHIPQSLTNTLPPGYILTQGVGMQHNPNMIQPTFIPQQLQYVPAGVPIYNPQIVTSSQGGGGAGGYYAATAQPQTFVVRSNYDLTNPVSAGYIQPNQQQHQPPPPPQHHHPQIQYATMPLQYQIQQQPPPQHHQPQQQQHHYQQPQQHFQAQLPYSQPPPPPPQNGIRRYGQN